MKSSASDSISLFTRFVRELRRRRVLRTAALYVIGAWLVLQIADVVFPGFDVPEAAIRVLVWTAFAGFPVALAFGWFFDIGPGGIRRTRPAGANEVEHAQPLVRSDYVILAVFTVVAGLLIYNATEGVLETPSGQVRETSDNPTTASLPKLEHSIAVLPFTNISNDPDNEFFCDGMSEEILNKLSGFSELNVIGRTSSFALKDSNYGIARISSLLGVRYVLQGSVRKAGVQLRIAAQLLDEAGRQVWSQTFDRQLVNVFDIQDEIAESVAGMVASQVMTKTHAAPPNLQAYEYYVAGREWQHRRERDKAIEALQKAIDIDPDFAEAWAELAMSYLYGAFSSAEINRAMQAITRALEIKPGLLRARAAQGLAYLLSTPPDPVAAERILREVLEQEPNMSDALLWLSSSLTEQGLNDESFEILRRAIRIDPLHGSIAGSFAQALLDRGNTDEAIALLERQLEIPDAGNTALVALRNMYMSVGRLVDMNRVSKSMLSRGSLSGYYGLALNYAFLGDMSRAAYWVELVLQENREQPIIKSFPAELLTWQGDYAQAARNLQEVMQSTGMDLAEMEYWLGALLARTGDYTTAIRLLSPMVDPDTLIGTSTIGDLLRDGVHALAWSYLHSGAEAKARPLLDGVARQCLELQQTGLLHESALLHYCAENALFTGDRQQALEMLEEAVQAGWRDYYIRENDPYWQSLRDDPQYIELMKTVKTDIDRQRAEVDRLDAK